MEDFNWCNVIGMLTIQTVITFLEAGAGQPIFMQFNEHLSDLKNNSAGVKSGNFLEQYTAWSIGYYFSWLVAASHPLLAIFCIVFCCYEDSRRMKLVVSLWIWFNIIASFIFDDALVSVAKVLMALESEKELLELQTEAGQISSMATFVATVIRCITVFFILVFHSMRGPRTPIWTIYDCCCQLAGFVALSTATFSMLISWSLYDVHTGDTVSRATIIGWMIGSVFLGCVGWALLLIFIVCIRYECNLDTSYKCAIGMLMLHTAITTIECSVGWPILMVFQEHVNDVDNSTVITSTRLENYKNLWSGGYYSSWVVAGIESVLLIIVIFTFLGFQSIAIAVITWFSFGFKFIFGDTWVSIIKICLAFESEKELQLLQTKAAQISSMATFVATVIGFLIFLLTTGITYAMGRKLFIFTLPGLFVGFVALPPATLSMLISWSWYVVYPGDTGNSGVTIGSMVGFMVAGLVVCSLIVACIYYIRKQVHNTETTDHLSSEGLR